MTDDSVDISAKDFATSATMELHYTHRDQTSQAQSLMASVGCALPTLNSTQGLQDAWRSGGLAELPKDETGHERHHCHQLERMVRILSVFFPEVSPRRFISCGHFVLGGGKNVQGSVKPDIVVSNDATTTEADLRKENAIRRVHILVECKTETGSSFFQQCAKYVERHGRPGAAFTFVLGLRANRLTVMLFTAKAWAKCATFEYTDCSHEVAQWMHLLMGERGVDRGLEQQVHHGLSFMGSKEVAEIYHRGLSSPYVFDDKAQPVRLSSATLKKAIYKAPGLFGSKTKVWRVNATITSWDGSMTAQEVLLKHSFVRKGRVSNGHYFLNEVAQLAEKKSLAGHWFPESVGLWISRDVSAPGSDIEARLGVVHVMKPAGGRTWQEAWPDTSALSFLQAARDVVRVLWVMRPFHHRDISTNNIMVNVAAAADGREAERQRPWLGWTGHAKAPPLVGAVIDLERGRWADDPSDFSQRQNRLAGRNRDVDESIDDAQTGTAPFLARAQCIARHVLLNVPTEKAKEIVEWLKQEGHHRYWHDLESLLLCLLNAIYSKWAHISPDIASLLGSWCQSGFTFGLTGEWLDTHARNLDKAIRVIFDADASVKETSLILKSMFIQMRPAFLPTIGTDDRDTFANLRKAFVPLESVQPFQAVLEALIKAIALMEELEGSEPSPSAATFQVGKRGRSPSPSADATRKRVCGGA